MKIIRIICTLFTVAFLSPIIALLLLFYIIDGLFAIAICGQWRPMENLNKRGEGNIIGFNWDKGFFREAKM